MSYFSLKRPDQNTLLAWMGIPGGTPHVVFLGGMGMPGGMSHTGTRVAFLGVFWKGLFSTHQFHGLTTQKRHSFCFFSLAERVGPDASAKTVPLERPMASARIFFLSKTEKISEQKKITNLFATLSTRPRLFFLSKTETFSEQKKFQISLQLVTNLFAP